ncbi:MFS transporter, partial [bacterium]|nr:MFS transporter [bacterium]
VFGIIQSTDYGWIKAKQMFNAFGVNWDFSGYSISIVSIIIGLILLLIFMYWEARIESKGKTPLVSLKIFTNKQFNAGLATSMVMSLGQAGLIFSIPVFIQAVLGKDAFHTGLAMLPLSIAAFICAPLGGFLSHKIPPKYLVQFGLFLNFIGYLVLRNSFSTTATTSNLVLGLIILGSGMGFIMAQIGNITMSAVSSKQAGEASGVSNTVRQLGSTLGTAVIGALLLTTLTNSMVDKVNASEVFPEQFKERIVSEVSKSGDSLEFEASPNINYGFPEKMPDFAKDLVKNEMKYIVSEATVDGNKVALWYAAWIAFIGVIVASWLPKGTNIEKDDDISVKNK